MKDKILSIILAAAIGLGIGATGERTYSNIHKELNNENILAVAWQQSSGEANALRVQAYNSAKNYLDKIIKKPTTKKYAIVLDIDETVLDNSSYMGELIKTSKNYSEESFTNWCKQAKAPVIAGAVDFTNYAISRGVDVFYVSNRTYAELDATIKNFKNVRLPNADKEHILLKENTSNKMDRWNKIKNTHNLIMYCGDNLGDFPENTINKNPKERKAVVNKNGLSFGSNYIILPNPTYGDFESSIYNWNFNKSNKEKINDRLKYIKSINQ